MADRIVLRMKLFIIEYLLINPLPKPTSITRYVLLIPIVADRLLDHPNFYTFKYYFYYNFYTIGQGTLRPHKYILYKRSLVIEIYIFPRTEYVRHNILLVS